MPAFLFQGIDSQVLTFSSLPDSEDEPAIVHGLSSSQIWSLAHKKEVRKRLAKAFGIDDGATETGIAKNVDDNLPTCFDFGATAEWTISQPGLDAWQAVLWLCFPFSFARFRIMF